MPFCPECGSESEPDQEVCSFCNSQLLPNRQPAQSTAGVDDNIAAPRTLRIAAGLIDYAIAVLLAILVLSPGFRMFNLIGLKKLISLVIPSIYLLLKDCIDGKSIGKLIIGLTAFNTHEGKPAGFSDSILRNWFLAVPLIGPTILGPITAIQIFIRNRRWGDGFSNTIVVTDAKIGKI